MMGRWWWMEVMAAALAVAAIAAFVLWPVVLRRWGARERGARQPIERAFQRVQLLLAAASVGLLAAAVGIPLAARLF